MFDIAYASTTGTTGAGTGMGSTIMMIVVSITDRTVVIETSEDRVRVEFLKSAIGQVGTLDEQAAAQQRPAKKDKKADKAEEKTVEAPAEKTEDSESK